MVTEKGVDFNDPQTKQWQGFGGLACFGVGGVLGLLLDSIEWCGPG
jgi:hypothetical protein